MKPATGQIASVVIVILITGVALSGLAFQYYDHQPLSSQSTTTPLTLIENNREHAVMITCTMITATQTTETEVGFATLTVTLNMLGNVSSFSHYYLTVPTTQFVTSNLESYSGCS